MKKVKRIVACAVSALLVSSTLSLGGCRYSGIKTEDDIYSALMETTLKFLETEDELTINMTVTEERSDKDKPEEIKIAYSVMPEEEKMFFTMQSEDEELTIKLFEAGGKPLLYKKVRAKQFITSGGVITNSMTVETEDYHIASPIAVEQLTGWLAFYTYANFDLKELCDDYGYSFSETKSAHESVYAEQLAKKRITDETADAKFEMRAEKSFNELSYEFSSQIKTRGVKSGVDGYYTVEYSEKVVEKKGKTLEMFASQDVTHTAQPSNEERYENTSINLKLDGSFDEEGYDEIQADVSNGESIPSLPFIARNMEMLFHVNGCVTQKTTVANTVDTDYIFRDLSKDYNKTGFSIEWFTDEAYANPFVPSNLSYEQFCAIKNVYGKMTIYDGYAVVAHDYTVRDNRSDAYKAVFGPISKTPQKTDDLKVYNLEEESTVGLPVASDEYQVFIDGKACDETNRVITFENGKFYHLEIAEVVTDEQYSIFDVDASVLGTW